MANAVSNALKRKKELLRELAEIDGFLAMHERFAAIEITREPPPFPHQEVNGSGDRLMIQGFDAPRKQRGRPAEFVELIEKIVREAGRPQQRSQLVEALESRGLTIPSSDKERYLGTILWRERETFINLTGEGYWFRREACPAVGYDPEKIQGIVIDTADQLTLAHKSTEDGSHD